MATTITVTINAAGSQAGAQSFVNSLQSMAGALTQLGPRLTQTNSSLNTLIQTLQNTSNANTGMN